MLVTKDTKYMLPVGTKLHNGTLTIVRALSSGGFGNTYEALNSFGMRVGVKEFFLRDLTVRSEDSTTASPTADNMRIFEEQKNKFYREALRLYKLSHPNIIRVYDRFEENGTAYYVMDYISEGSLSDRLKQMKKPFSSVEVFRILDTLLSALAYLHQQDMLHLDLKPANIMLTAEGSLVLIDFGASKTLIVDELTKISISHSTLAYTPGYAPMEQVMQSSKFIGPWSDLYALGATLYKLLTNAKEIPDNMEITARGKDAFVFPTTVDPILQELIIWLMTPLYSLRPQSVSEVREFLAKKQQVAKEVHKHAIKEAAHIHKEEPAHLREGKEPRYQAESRLETEEKTIIDEVPFVEKYESIAYNSVKPADKQRIKKWLRRVGMWIGSIIGIFLILFVILCIVVSVEDEIDHTNRSMPTELLHDGLQEPITPIKIHIEGLGEVDYIGLTNENDRAEGYGFASLDLGLYYGKFKNGSMEGEGLFLFTKGIKYAFRGTFKSNTFAVGRLYDPQTNKTFEGAFTSEGQPNLKQGKWIVGNSLSPKTKDIYLNAPRELSGLKDYVRPSFPDAYTNDTVYSFLVDC